MTKSTAKKAAKQKAAAKKTVPKNAPGNVKKAKKKALKKTAPKTTPKNAPKNPPKAKKKALKKTAPRTTPKNAPKNPKQTKKKALKKTAPRTTPKTAQKSIKKAKKRAARVHVVGTRHKPSVFLLVHLPLAIGPLERAQRFEGPVAAALGALGSITGGGTSISETGGPESCDLEVEVHDVARALPILRRVLSEGGAPSGTIIARLTANDHFEVLLEL